MLTRQKSGHGHLLLEGRPDRDLVPDIVRILATFGLEIHTATRKSLDDTEALRMVFHGPPATLSTQTHLIHRELRALTESHDVAFTLRGAGTPTRVAVMVSSQGHCLRRLFSGIRDGSLPIEISRVISNHPDLESLAAAHGVPFTYVPVETERKHVAEAEQLRVLSGSCELLVLARYMQILSVGFLKAVGVPVINIHHSLLPAFPGAAPYRQAFDRGVKIIGATAHFATSELDEGPIITQGAESIDDSPIQPTELARQGERIEADVLAQAVSLMSQDRVVPTLSGKTIIF